MSATRQPSPKFPFPTLKPLASLLLDKWHPISSFARASMAAVSASSLAFQLPLSVSHQVRMRTSSLKLFSVGLTKSEFQALRTSRLRVCCAAKPETVDKVCAIVRKQLALPPESELTPESTFSSLGADSLDTVEIVMGLEEEFDISVEEENSQNITNVQEAADLIEKLVQQKLNA